MRFFSLKLALAGVLAFSLAACKDNSSGGGGSDIDLRNLQGHWGIVSATDTKTGVAITAIKPGHFRLGEKDSVLTLSFTGDQVTSFSGNSSDGSTAKFVVSGRDIFIGDPASKSTQESAIHIDSLDASILNLRPKSGGSILKLQRIDEAALAQLKALAAAIRKTKGTTSSADATTTKAVEEKKPAHTGETVNSVASPNQHWGPETQILGCWSIVSLAGFEFGDGLRYNSPGKTISKSGEIAYNFFCLKQAGDGNQVLRGEIEAYSTALNAKEGKANFTFDGNILRVDADNQGPIWVAMTSQNAMTWMFKETTGEDITVSLMRLGAGEAQKLILDVEKLKAGGKVAEAPAKSNSETGAQSAAPKTPKKQMSSKPKSGGSAAAPQKPAPAPAAK